MSETAGVAEVRTGYRVGRAVLHAVWAGDKLWIWGESHKRFGSFASSGAGQAERHGFALTSDEIMVLLRLAGIGDAAKPGTCTLDLPGESGVVMPSATLARQAGWFSEGDEHALVGVEVEAVSVPAEFMLKLADAVIDDLHLGESVKYVGAVVRFAQHVVSRQRFVPMMSRETDGGLAAIWYPWLNDVSMSRQAALICHAMPPVLRAAARETNHRAWPIFESLITEITNSICRQAIFADDLDDTVRERDPAADAQIAWMRALLTEHTEVPGARGDVGRRVRKWIGSLEERGESASFRLFLRLHEPVSEALPGDLDKPSDDLMWSVSFHLQALDVPEIIVDASDIWAMSQRVMTIDGVRLEGAQDLLLAELGRASRFFKKLEDAMDDPEPIEILLETNEAYEFLRETRPVLEEQGIGVDSPMWWDSPLGRLGARLRVEGAGADPFDTGGAAGSASSPQLGLSTLVNYHWEIAIGDTTLTLHEFEKLANLDSPLVRVGGRWVEVRPEDVRHAMNFIQDNPGGQIELSEALRLAYSSDPRQTGVTVLGMDASGWVSDILDAGGEDGSRGIPVLETPESFMGSLRPYQARGLSWLAFLERFGFGLCLADDMGLGKTIQLLALLVHEREIAAEKVPPTLLIVPMSVVGNWMHETKRFAPQLKLLVHHGVERLQGDAFIDEARASDLIVTTYALAHRDAEVLGRVGWRRLVLDEAQCIKNPQAKQSQAVRAIPAQRRIALTGTPVENRLSELWSIMDFLNPGYLGTPGNFRRRFSVPIERYQDKHRLSQLRGLVRPFVLRRVKTDPTVVADLPDKLETKEFCHLTPEQAELYEASVKRMLGEVERSEGIRRRGIVLATLIKLKQICNHPSQMLKDHDFQATSAPPDPNRSGKTIRLLEMLDEVIAEGDQALVFTQFRQMGHLLASMLRHHLDREILFLHGGTPQGQRQKLIERFQKAEGDRPILILSLKAGGVGLNLTAATHVFHFDRWWNPAVENQATDRAYRIGQTRTVQVHKFVVRGTLEERIDEMIESKTELAENIIGAGERWLTELGTDQLRDILTLRADAIDSD